VTNWVTIAIHTQVHQPTLADTQAQVGSKMRTTEVCELGFGTKRPPVQIRPPRPRSQATPLRGEMAFFFAYSRKVQQRLRAKLGAKLSAKPLERLKRLRIGNLGVYLHRQVDLCMAQDPGPMWAAAPRSWGRGSRRGPYTTPAGSHPRTGPDPSMATRPGGRWRR
jgi:hypothetical protein